MYVSNYDGKNLKEISSSVYYLDCIDKNTFLFSEYEDGKEAHAENMSLSKWVVSKIMERIEPHYPEGGETLPEEKAQIR